MIRGWRLDPRWIAHYEKRDRERAQRAMQRLEMEHRMKYNADALEASMRRLRTPRPNFMS
jgi:hypothetical protein